MDIALRELACLMLLDINKFASTFESYLKIIRYYAIAFSYLCQQNPFRHQDTKSPSSIVNFQFAICNCLCLGDLVAE